MAGKLILVFGVGSQFLSNWLLHRAEYSHDMIAGVSQIGQCEFKVKVTMHVFELAFDSTIGHMVHS